MLGYLLRPSCTQKRLGRLLCSSVLLLVCLDRVWTAVGLACSEKVAMLEGKALHMVVEAVALGHGSHILK